VILPKKQQAPAKKKPAPKAAVEKTPAPKAKAAVEIPATTQRGTI
jgi:hypothetical protein